MFRAVVRRFVKPELDAGREERVRRLYDSDCGYDRYHSVCRRSFRREVSEAVTPLQDEGVEDERTLERLRALGYID